MHVLETSLPCLPNMPTLFAEHAMLVPRKVLPCPLHPLDAAKMQPDLNKMFPHTSVFLTQYAAKSFLIDDTPIYYVQRIAKRGGHNKLKAFTIDYPSLIVASYMKGHISLNCKDSIFKDICTQYLPTLLFNKYIVHVETFDATGYRENIKRYFPKHAYWVAWINVMSVPFRMIKRKLF